MKKILFIGGPLDGQFLKSDEVPVLDFYFYIPYNAAQELSGSMKLFKSCYIFEDLLKNAKIKSDNAITGQNL